MSQEVQDILSNEIEPEPECDTQSEIEPEPEIQYDKRGRIKKPRTQAQIEAFQKARAKWIEMRADSVAAKKEAQFKSREITLEKQKADAIVKCEKAKADAIVKCEKAKARYEKQKSKIIKSVPEEVPEVEENEVEENEEPEIVVKTKRPPIKKKQIVVVAEESEDELESDDPSVIFVKRKVKPKEPVPDPRFDPRQNHFGRPYFYNVNAMS